MNAEFHETPGFPGFDHIVGSEPEICFACRQEEPGMSGDVTTEAGRALLPRIAETVALSPRTYRAGNVTLRADLFDDLLEATLAVENERRRLYEAVERLRDARGSELPDTSPSTLARYVSRAAVLALLAPPAEEEQT